MLIIVVPGAEGWDEQKEEFVPATPPVTLHLEHSLLSLSKWEAKWEKPFLSKEAKTVEETIDYIRCMNLNPATPDDVYQRLTAQNFRDINAYIDTKRSATTIRDEKHSTRSSEIVTSELIYYWMVALNIPFECQKWHLNRLLTLIRVCNIKNQPPKKMGKHNTMKQNAALNAARRSRMHSKG
jgi:hypothetical protein